MILWMSIHLQSMYTALFVVELILIQYSSATNIRRMYIQVLGGHYQNSFKNYTTTLQKRFPTAFAKESFNYSTIVEITSFSFTSLQSYSNLASFSNLWTSSDKLAKSEAFFDLGDRYEDINKNALINLDMPAQHAELIEFTELWTSAFVLLTNTITSEYSFMLDFYSKEPLCKELFAAIFAPTFQHMIQFTESFTSQTWDSIAVLLLMRKAVDMRETMKKRGVSEDSLDQFWKDLDTMFMERFKLIFEKNFESVKQLVENDYKQLISNKSIVTREKQSCLLSKKFASYCTSIYRLGFGQDIEKRLLALAKTFEAIIIQMGKCSKSTKTGYDQVLVINCADLILKRLLAYGINNQITTVFGNLLNSSVEQQIDDLLKSQPQVNRMVTFVREFEKINPIPKEANKSLNKQVLTSTIAVGNEKKSAADHLKIIIADMGERKWQKYVQKLYQELQQMFPNEDTSKEIMRRAMEQWVPYFKVMKCLFDAIYGTRGSDRPSFPTEHELDHYLKTSKDLKHNIYMQLKL
jgi:hypothetical protein